MKWNRIALVLITVSLLIVPMAWSQRKMSNSKSKKVTDEVIAALMRSRHQLFGKTAS